MSAIAETMETPLDAADEAPETARPKRERAPRPSVREAIPAAAPSARKTAAQKDADAAAKVLGQVNDLLVLGIMAVSAIPGTPLPLWKTASALAEGNETFMLQATEALATDPALVKSILRIGNVGGKAALTTAYLSLAIGVAPAVMEDIREASGGDDGGD